MGLPEHYFFLFASSNSQVPHAMLSNERLINLFKFLPLGLTLHEWGHLEYVEGGFLHMGVLNMWKKYSQKDTIASVIDWHSES